MEFTPPKQLREREPATPAATVLRLIAYGGERPVCALGSCTTGSSKESLLQLLNDTDLDRVITLEKAPTCVRLVDPASGAVLAVEGSLDVPRRSSRTLRVTWHATGPGALCEALRWRMTDGARQARLEAPYPGVPRTSGMLDPSALSAAANVKLPATPLAASPLLNNGGRAPVRLVTPHRAGAGSPNVRGVALAADGGGRTLDFRRVGSAEAKRERGLISWLNSEVATVEAASAGLDSGCTTGVGVRRLLGEVGGKAYLYFKRDASFAAAAAKVESKIAARHLALKDVESTLSDVHRRKEALAVLTAYHPFWLAVGLQTVLGKALVLSPGNMLALMRPPGSSSSSGGAGAGAGAVEVPAFLRAYLSDHLLADPELAAAYRGAAYKTPEYWEALGPRVLGRVLLLVLLLDRLAQRPDLPAGTPSLFRQEAAIKTSEQVLLEFLQPRLAGAGDVRHQLRAMGYVAEYVQHARDEADFRVAKPSDLRDGTRLAKLLDNLRKKAQSHGGAAANGNAAGLSAQPSSASVASSSGISARLLGTGAAGGPGAVGASRLPSPHEDLLPTMAFPQHTGRPLDETNMRNNCLRLARALQAHGRITLGVLWQMAMHFKLRKHVDVKTLEREAARLRRAAAAGASSSDTPAAASASSSASAGDDAVLLRYFNDPASQALLQWVRAACALHGVGVDNFTWSLADGRALCYLVHTYLPEALPKSRISVPDTPATTDEMARLTGGTEYVKLETLKANGWSAVYEMGGVIHDDGLAAAYKAAVAANFRALHAAGDALGLPALLGAEDYLEDGPDELAAILYVALLGEALMKLTSERRAGYVIMEYLRRRLCWRPSYMRAALQRYKEGLRRSTAAATIQATWRMAKQRRRFLQLQQAACVLQAFARRRLASRQVQQLRQLARQEAAATVIQAHVRRHLTQKKFSHEIRAARREIAAATIQAVWRGHCQRSRYLAARDAAVKQQEAAVIIQAAWRSVVAQRQLAAARSRVLLIQAHVRGMQARRLVQKRLQSLVHIQACWRAEQARRQVAALRAQQRSEQEHRSAALLQAVVRGHQLRRQVAAQHRAATVAQAWWRMVQARRDFLAARQAAVSIQSAFRGFAMRQQLAQHHAAATAVQCAWRRHSAMGQLRTARSAAVAIQAAWRSHCQRSRYLAARDAAVKVQACVRMHQAQKRFLVQRQAAVAIQAAWRSHQARTAYLQQQEAAVIIQAAWRSVVAQRQLAAARSRVLLIQAHVRGMQARRLVQRRLQSLVHIQTCWRAEQARRQVAALRAQQRSEQEHRSAALLQAVVRGHQLRRQVAGQHRAATVVQAWWRMVQARREYTKLQDITATEAFWAREQQKQAEILMEISRQYMRGVSAAMRIQAHWRGYQARKAFAPVWREHRDSQRERQAALAIQTAWRSYTARRDYCRQREALRVIGAVLVPLHRARRELRRRRDAHQVQLRAVLAIQAGVRMWLARRRLESAVQAAVQIQAAWRGYAVRKRDGRAKREARRRLQAAAADARRSPSRQIGNRAREALELLLRNNKNLVQVMQAVQVIETATRYSRDCCKLIARNEGVTALLRFMRGLNRSKPHIDVLNRTLNVLLNICRYDDLLPDVYHSEECLTVLSERLQFFRDTEEVFNPTVAVLQRLTSPPELAGDVQPAVRHKWEGIHQVQFRKADMERKYLERLEGDKGSDVSAREATRRLLVLQQQGTDKDQRAPAQEKERDTLVRRQVLAAAGSAAAALGPAPIPGLKNTIVKTVVQRLAATNAAPGTSAAAAGVKRPAATYLDDATGNVVVKLKDTEIVTVAPGGEIVLSTDGWFTQTTLDHMNKALNVLQIKVTANGDVRDGNWQVSYGPHLLRYYDGIVLHPKNPATAAQRAPAVLAAMTGAAAGTANVMARARAVLGLGGAGDGSGAGGLGNAQQQALAALAGLADTTMTDSDTVRRLKAQGRM
eukprot:XP_001695440.1 predicted protein [Chlamydomonas reinhardtii]